MISKRDILLGGWEKSVLIDLSTGDDIGTVCREYGDIIVTSVNHHAEMVGLLQRAKPLLSKYPDLYTAIDTLLYIGGGK